jgi:hypothetical protein
MVLDVSTGYIWGGGPFDHYLAVFLTKVMVDAASMETSGWNLGRQVLQIKAELGG